MDFDVAGRLKQPKIRATGSYTADSTAICGLQTADYPYHLQGQLPGINLDGAVIVYYFLDSTERELVAVIPKINVYSLESTYYLLNSKPKVVDIYQNRHLEDKFGNKNSKQSIPEEIIFYGKSPVIYEILDNQLVKLNSNEEILEETLIESIF